MASMWQYQDLFRAILPYISLMALLSILCSSLPRSLSRAAAMSIRLVGLATAIICWQEGILMPVLIILWICSNLIQEFQILRKWRACSLIWEVPVRYTLLNGLPMVSMER